MPGVLSVFARWWTAVVACIGPSEAESSKKSSPLKPLKVVAQANARSAVSPSIAQGKPHPDTHRERFLRHPSITSSEARGTASPSPTGRSVQSAPRPSRKPVEAARHEIPPAFRAHDWSSPSYRPAPVHPPRRPPRPPSVLLPSVVITPCTPDGIGNSIFDAAILATPESPLDKTISAYRVAAAGSEAYSSAGGHVHAEAIQATGVLYQTSYRRAPPASNRIPGADPPREDLVDSEDPQDTVVVAPSSPYGGHHARRASHVYVSSKLRSLVEVDTASTGLDDPADFTGSSVLDQRLSATWIYSMSFEQLAGFRPLTSTPKFRITNANDTDSIGSDLHVVHQSDDTGGTAHSLRLPEEQLDLLPYPDVFDFELYYGPEAGRLSISRDGSSSIIRCSVDEKNVFLPGTSSIISTTRRFGLVMSSRSRVSGGLSNDENQPPAMNPVNGRRRSRSSHEVYAKAIIDHRSVSTPKRPVDDSIPAFRPRTAVLATPGSSTLASTVYDSGRHVLLPIPLREQMQQQQRSRSHSDSAALDMFPTPTQTRARSRSTAHARESSFDTPSPLPGGPGKARTYYTGSKAYEYGPPNIPLPPIVIVSSVSASERSRGVHGAFRDTMGCDWSVLAEVAHEVASSDESYTSPEALRSRLEQTCQNFSRPVANASWIEDSRF